jgi:flagellar capping protein FliD
MATPITLGDDQSGSLLGALFLPTTPTTTESLQAIVTYNGMTIKRAQNIITDVAPGLTLELLGPSSGAGVLGSVTNNYNGVLTTIKQFVSLYNAAYTEVAKQMEIDAEGNPVETAYLHGLSSMMSINDLYKKGAAAYKGLSFSADLANLSSIGIKTEKNGTLTITDEATLLSTIKTNFEGVRKLFGDYASSTSALFQVRALPTNMDRLAGKNIAVTIANTDGTLKATLSCPDAGIEPETITLTSKIVDGNSTVNFKGLLLQYSGNGSEGTSDATTLVCTQGIAATFYDAIQTATKPSTSSATTKSLFEVANQEILNGIERVQERIDTITATVDARIKAMQSRTSKLYEAYNRATAASQLLQTLYSDR